MSPQSIHQLKSKIKNTEDRIEAEERRAVTMGSKYHRPYLIKLRREAMRLRTQLMMMEKWV